MVFYRPQKLFKKTLSFLVGGVEDLLTQQILKGFPYLPVMRC